MAGSDLREACKDPGNSSRGWKGGGEVHRFKTPVRILGAVTWSAEKGKVQDDLQAFEEAVGLL